MTKTNITKAKVRVLIHWYLTGSVIKGKNGFRAMIIDSLDILYQHACSNAIYVSSVRTLNQRLQSASIFVKLIIDSKYFHTYRKRGSDLPEHMLPALFTALSEMGLTFANSKFKRFLKCVMSTHGYNAGRFRSLMNMNAPNVLRVADVVFMEEVQQPEEHPNETSEEVCL